MSRKREDKEFVNNQYKPFTAKTERQKELFQALDSHTIIAAYGAAGTGKTACIVSKACEYLYDNKVQRIIITRPLVEAGEELGSLPGDVDEKIDPYLAPVKVIMNKILGKSTVEGFIHSEKIEGIPLALCRGHTFDNAFVILDEAQNTTPAQMKMFLTRIGEHSVMGISGDTRQSDIRGLNGLDDLLKKISWAPWFKSVKFTRSDIVRHSIISDILSAYDEP